MNFGDGGFLDDISKLFTGTLAEDLWDKTLELSGELDAAIAPAVVEPDFWRVFRFTLNLELCGQDTLFKLHPKGMQHCVSGKQSCTIRVLGGPLSSGITFTGPFGPGHEVGHNLGYIYGGNKNLLDVDHLCESLEQEHLWREAYGAGARADAEARPYLEDSNCHQLHTLPLEIHLCAPERLAEIGARLADGTLTPTTHKAVAILGGPLPNGRLYVSQGSLSRQIALWVSGKTNPCEGL